MVSQTQLDQNIKQAAEEEIKRNAPVLFLVSMTTSMLAYARGIITDTDMLRSTCLFGCAKEHVINDQGLLPMEATWLNEERKHSHGYGAKDHLVKLDDVDPEIREKIVSFIRIVKVLDEDWNGSRVFWQSDWYRLLVNFHPAPECAVYLNHGWNTIGKMREKHGPLEVKPGRYMG